MNIDDVILQIRGLHRKRRFAMKTTQKITLSLEAYIRRNATDWTPDLDEKARARVKAEVQKIIKAARSDQNHEHHAVVSVSDAAAAPSAALRKDCEGKMEALAEQLPVYAWIASVRGAGALGLATIVAEAGELTNYANIAKLWSRLGFAPYDGHAGSTWKRATWRPRALSSDEWIKHPFSGERYALMQQIASWLWVKQWIGKAKTGTGVGAPNGPYGEVYAARRAKTMITHSDWSDGHRHSDALRLVMKEFLKNLWVEWQRTAEQAEPLRIAAE